MGASRASVLSTLLVGSRTAIFAQPPAEPGGRGGAVVCVSQTHATKPLTRHFVRWKGDAVAEEPH